MVAESWLNERAIGINRGQRFGIHQVLVYLGATLGQNLLGVRDVAAPDLFSIAAITLTLAPVPVAMTASTAPKPIRRLRVDLRWLAGISPLALTGCPLVGAVNGAIWSLAPIYAQSQGLAPNEVGWFMALLITGGAVSQSPVGKVSDRPDRRWMIIAVALISSAAGIALVVSCEGGLRLLADHLFPVRRACERHRRLRALRRGRERHAADVRDRRHRRATDRLRPDGGTRHGDAVRLCGHAAPRARSVLHLVLLQRPLAAERPTFVVTMPRTAPMPPNLDPRAEEGAKVVGGEEPVGEGTDAGRPARERRETVP